jgi:uroporphyrinogen-III synthase
MASPVNPESRSLSGRRILVTRARHQAGRLSAELAALEAEVIEIPAIEILPPASWDPLDNALRNLPNYQWLIITSANAVRSLHDRTTTLSLDPACFSHLKIAAVGAATASALNEAGLAVSIVPGEYVAESLITALGDQTRNQHVLIVRAAIARDFIPDALKGTAAQVDVVDAYQTVIPEGSIRRIAEVFASGQSLPDAATFTSSSTVTNFLHLLEAAGLERPDGLRAISIGPITSQTLRDHDWEPSAEADPHDMRGLVAATICALSPEP